ncbi:uncharacterized protein METZ01_LOCUS488222, partial [marine metagenome]
QRKEICVFYDKKQVFFSFVSYEHFLLKKTDR